MNLDKPTIPDFTNSQHDHSSIAQGGFISAASGTVPIGSNTSGLVFNTTALPPSWRPGSIDVAGTHVKITATTTQSLSFNAFKQSRQALDSGLYFWSFLDSSENLKWSLALGPAVASHTGTITSVSVSSGTGTLTAATGTINSGDAGNILVIYGTSGTVDGVFLILTAGTGTCTFKTSGTTSGAVGNYAIFSPVADTSSPAPVFSDGVNQYTLDANGVPTTGIASYRLEGVWSTDGSSNVQSASIVSYGAGLSKQNSADASFNWQAYPAVPVFTGCGTVSSAAGWYKRTADGLKIRASAVCGTTTAVNVTVSLPGGLNLDTSKRTASAWDVYGTITRVRASLALPATNAGPWPVIDISGTTNAVGFAGIAASGTAFTPATGTSELLSGDGMVWEFDVPCIQFAG